MLSLTNPLESTIITGIGELPVKLAFNNVLDWYEVSENDGIEWTTKVELGWQNFFDGIGLTFETADDYEVAVKALGDLNDYIHEEPYNNIEGDDQSGPSPKSFSYTQDAEAIYASFIFDYGIDLLDEMDKLRWEKFRALFNNLSAKSPLMRIIDIRQRSTEGLEGDALTNLVEMQSYYALEGQSTSAVDDAIGSMFSMLAMQAKQGQ